MSQENVELAQTLGNLYNERGFATGKSWSTLLGDRFLPLRRLWTTSRPTQQSVGELSQCESKS